MKKNYQNIKYKILFIFLFFIIFLSSCIQLSSYQQSPFESKQQEQFAHDFFEWRITHDYNAFINIKTFTIFINLDKDTFDIIKNINNPDEVKEILDLKDFNTNGLEYVYVVINSSYMIELKTGEIWI